MKKVITLSTIVVALVAVIAIMTQSPADLAHAMGGKPQAQPPVADSGVKKVTAKVKVQANGMTVEQSNVRKRLEAENMPGAVKHLYLISAYSGQVIMYSTVKGKVTSSGKRLTSDKTMVKGYGGGYSKSDIMPNIGDDGTYGSSIQYLYWWDTAGKYHQQYVTGGMILHISDQPLAVKSVIINISK